MIDRVEVSIIEEQQPRWLAFVNGEADFVERVDAQFISLAMPRGQVAPNLAKKGIRGYRQTEPGSTFYLFNMEDPTVGGYTPERVALRRAVSLGLDLDAEIQLIRRGQAVPAESPILPHTTGYDPKWKSEFSEFSPARAKALLDMYGFVDRDGDGWRDMPDGTPLVLRLATEPDQRSRQFNELTKKNMDALNVRLNFEVAQWPENLKAARAGKLAIWQLGGSAAAPDGQGSLARFDSKQIGGQNMARFKLPAFDSLIEKLRILEDGPQRNALFDEAKRLSLAYMPYKYRVHRTLTDMAYPWVIGYRRPVFWQEWWHYVDIDTAELARHRK
jgi:ABC-type transport system substrate-binding protein